MFELLPPGMLLIFGGILLPLIPKQLRSVWLIALPIIGLLQEHRVKTIVGDMCQFGLKDPFSKRPIRKRTMLNHTSGKLHELLHDHWCKGHRAKQ